MINGILCDVCGCELHRGAVDNMCTMLHKCFPLSEGAQMQRNLLCIFGLVIELVGACAVGGLVLVKIRRVETKLQKEQG